MNLLIIEQTRDDQIAGVLVLDTTVLDPEDSELVNNRWTDGTINGWDCLDGNVYSNGTKGYYFGYKYQTSILSLPVKIDGIMFHLMD